MTLDLTPKSYHLFCNSASPFPYVATLLLEEKMPGRTSLHENVKFLVDRHFILKLTSQSYPPTDSYRLTPRAHIKRARA